MQLYFTDNRLLAEWTALLLDLKQNYGQVKDNQYEQHCGPKIFSQASELVTFVHKDQMVYGADQHKHYEGQIGKNEDEEVLVVLGAQTVVYKRTVMIVKLHTSVADGAVKWRFRLYHLVEHTQILNVDLLLKKLVDQRDKLEAGLEIAWSTESRQ